MHSSVLVQFKDMLHWLEHALKTTVKTFTTVFMSFICRWNVIIFFYISLIIQKFLIIFFFTFVQFTANISVLDSVLTPLNQPLPTQVELLEKVCKKLRFKYHPKYFANPMLASFYSNLEALAYDEVEQEVVDVTIPQYEVHDEKIQEFIDGLTEEFGMVKF